MVYFTRSTTCGCSPQLASGQINNLHGAQWKITNLLLKQEKILYSVIPCIPLDYQNKHLPPSCSKHLSGYYCFLNGPTPTSFHLFSVFSNKQYNFLQQINVKKCPSSRWRWNSNPRRLKHEFSPITTKPGLPPYHNKTC